MTVTSNDSITITSDSLGVEVLTEHGYEVWPIESHELAIVPGGGTLASLLARRPNGEAVCLACSPDAPAGTVDDVVIIGFVRLGE